MGPLGSGTDTTLAKSCLAALGLVLTLGRTSGSEDDASPVRGREREVDAGENPSLQIPGRSRLGVRHLLDKLTSES